MAGSSAGGPRKPCNSHCGDDCAGPCPCAQTAADRQTVDAYGNLRGLCPCLPAKRVAGPRCTKIVERAWVRVAHAAVEQWLAHTTALGVPGAHFFLLLQNSSCNGCKIHISDMQLSQSLRQCKAKQCRANLSKKHT